MITSMNFINTTRNEYIYSLDLDNNDYEKIIIETTSNDKIMNEDIVNLVPLWKSSDVIIHFSYNYITTDLIHMIPDQFSFIKDFLELFYKKYYKQFYSIEKYDTSIKYIMKEISQFNPNLRSRKNIFSLSCLLKLNYLASDSIHIGKKHFSLFGHSIEWKNKDRLIKFPSWSNAIENEFYSLIVNKKDVIEKESLINKVKEFSSWFNYSMYGKYIDMKNISYISHYKNEINRLNNVIDTREVLHSENIIKYNDSIDQLNNEIILLKKIIKSKKEKTVSFSDLNTTIKYSSNHDFMIDDTFM